MVAVKFHYQRVINSAINSVRKRISATLTKKQSRFIKENWKLLNKHFDKIDNQHRHYSFYLKRRVTNLEILNYILSLNKELADAYSLYQDFLCLISLDDKEYQTKLLEQWLNDAESRNITEFQSVIKTIRKWKIAICASFETYNDHKLSNGFI